MNQEKNCFVLLLSLSKVNATVGRAVMDAIRKRVDSGATPAWIDAHGVGLFIETDLPAHRIWQEAKPEMALDDWTAVKDMLILQVGPGWYARDNQIKAAAWLHARFPRPTF